MNDPEKPTIIPEVNPSTFPIPKDKDKCTVSNDKTKSGPKSSTMKDDRQPTATATADIGNDSTVITKKKKKKSKCLATKYNRQ